MGYRCWRGVRAEESYEGAAIRELEEELEIGDIKIEYMFNFKYRSDINNVNLRIYKCVYDGEINVQKDEIEEGDFKTIEEIKQMSERGLLCPDTALFFKKYLELQK